MRTATIKRKTAETDIQVSVNLDGSGTYDIETGIGFKYVAERMNRGEAAAGGEESGGYAFAFHLPERDGVLSALLLVESLALSNRTLGAVSLLGPLRMDYDKALRSVRGAAQELSRFVESVYGEA